MSSQTEGEGEEKERRGEGRKWERQRFILDKTQVWNSPAETATTGDVSPGMETTAAFAGSEVRP